MALVGNLKDIKLANLVQLNCMERNTAKLTIEHNGKYGFIYFEKGQVVHAEYDPLVGEDAFYRLIQLFSGNFKVESGIRAPAKTISANWNNLLLEGLHRRDTYGQKEGINYNGLIERLFTIKGVERIYVINRAGEIIAKSSDDIPEEYPLLALAELEIAKISKLLNGEKPGFVSLNLGVRNLILINLDNEHTAVLETDKKMRLDIILPLIKKAIK